MLILRGSLNISCNPSLCLVELELLAYAAPGVCFPVAATILVDELRVQSYWPKRLWRMLQYAEGTYGGPCRERAVLLQSIGDRGLPITAQVAAVAWSRSSSIIREHCQRAALGLIAFVRFSEAEDIRSSSKAGSPGDIRLRSPGAFRNDARQFASSHLSWSASIDQKEQTKSECAVAPEKGNWNTRR